MGLNVTDVGLEKNPGKQELKKHAAIIHCSNSLSLLQRKISNALLYHAYHELNSEAEHEITVKQLCKLIAYNGNNHAAIKDALKGLISTVIEWNVVNDTTGNEDWTASSILASVSLQGPICLYAYSPRMKKLLHSPSMFGKINLFIQARFKSSYGLALYENCIRYRGLPYTKWFDLQTFRKLMGVSDDIYPIFRDFKRRVLDKSIEEVNTYSELILELEIAKERRQVAKIRFSLKERAKKTKLGMNVTQSQTDETVGLKQKLEQQFGLSNEQVQEVMIKYDKDFIAEKMLIVELSKNYQEGRVKNVTGYFLSALKNNYQMGIGGQKEEKKDKKKDAMDKRLIEEAKVEYNSYRESVIDNFLEAKPTDEKNRILQRFREEAAASHIKTILRLQRKKYTEETVINSPQVKALLRQFALQEFPELQQRIMGIEKFIETLSACHRNAWHELQCESASVTPQVLSENP